LETLRGSSNKKTLYSTRSCVNWAFFGIRGSLKHSFHSRFKVAHSCKKKSNLHTNSLNKLLFFNLVLFKTNALFAKTCPKDFYNSQKKSWDSFKPFPDSLHYFIIIHFLCCYRWPHLANKECSCNCKYTYRANSFFTFCSIRSVFIAVCTVYIPAS
jgi:hypothetical protein